MSAANPILVETGTTTPLASWAFGSLGPLDVSAEHDFDVLNDGAGVETAAELSVWARFSNDAGATWDDTLQPYLGRWLQLKVDDVDGTGIEAQTTGWTPVGLGARLILNTIPANCRRIGHARLVVPAGFSAAGYTVDLIIGWQEGYAPLSQGFREAGIAGVVGGTADTSYTALLLGGTLAATGTPDNKVNLTVTTAWKSRGRPWVLYPGDLTLAASASGKARWVTIYLDDAGALNSVASSEVTAPAPIGDRPATPEGGVRIGWVHRDDGTIAGGDIYQDSPVMRSPFYLNVSGLACTLGPGKVIVDNRLVWKDTNTPLGNAPDNASSYIVANADGTFSFVDSGDWTDPGTEILHFITAASGAVTVRRDMRKFLGPPTLHFDAYLGGTLTVGQAAHWTAPPGVRPIAVKLPHGVHLGVRTIGDRTTGELRVPLEYWDGAAWTSVFSSTTYEPKLAYNATTLAVGEFLPDLLVFDPGTRFRFRVAAIPTTGGSADPADATASVTFELL